MSRQLDVLASHEKLVTGEPSANSLQHFFIVSGNQHRTPNPFLQPKQNSGPQSQLMTFQDSLIRASASKNAMLSYFTISKSYFINYTIPFYNTLYIQKLYYFIFSLKYYFLIFLYYFFHIITFFQLSGGIKYIYIYIYIFQYSVTV